MSNTASKPVKLDPEKIMKSLPEAFTGVSIPKHTRTIYLRANVKDISAEEARKAVSKLCKDLKLKIMNFRSDDEEADFVLEDPAFTKQMVSEARACLKAVNSFYSKYDYAYRYNDDACEIVTQIIRKVNHDE